MSGWEIRLSEETVDEDYFFFFDELLEVIRAGSTFSYCWFSSASCGGINGFYSHWIYRSKAEALQYVKRSLMRHQEIMPLDMAGAIGSFSETHPEVFVPKKFDSREEAMTYIEEAKKNPHIKNIEVFNDDGYYLHFSRKNGQWERLE